MSVPVSQRKLARWAAVSAVITRVSGGLPLAIAVVEVCELSFPVNEKGRTMSPKRRTLYRWVAAFQKGGFDALGDLPRIMKEPSRVLDEDVLSFLKQAKTKDREASIPDIIRSMEIDKVGKGSLSRTTVWRAARRMGLPIFAGKSKTDSTKRRFAYAHRMQMVLCDGKQFRAGMKQRRRLAFFFIDDATRKILVVVVGKSESKKLFLLGVMKVIRRCGRMNAIYVDNGSGFIAKDVEVVLARIGIHLIHGTKEYPEGRGKIERFNRTIKKDLLRTFRRDPTVDPGLASLQLRCDHYVNEVYNKNGHESLKKESPDTRWLKDTLDLDVPDDFGSLEKHFVVTKVRKVSNDNVVSVDSVQYEMPQGHAGCQVFLDQDLLHGVVSVIHEGKSVRLSPVDLVANAKGKRIKKKSLPENPEARTIRTAARRSFDRSFESIVTENGDFIDVSSNNEEE